MVRIVSFSILMLLLASSCKEKGEPAIVFAPQLLMDNEVYNADTSVHNWMRYEYYFIINPPQDRAELLRLAKAHHDSLSFLNDSIEKKYSLFERIYYKESSETPADFVGDRSGGFTNDDINDHKDDCICSFTMTNQRHTDCGLNRIKWTYQDVWP